MTAVQDRPLTAEQVRARLNQLQSDVTYAVQQYAAARERARDPLGPMREAVADLAAYHSAVTFQQREPNHDAVRAATEAFIEQVRERGLIFTPVDPLRPLSGLRVEDPAIQRQLTRTERAAREAARVRDDFARQHAALLREDEDKQRMQRVKGALDDGDLSAFREALELPAPSAPPRSVMTTGDLPVTR